MEQMSSVKKSTFCALCIALCLVLPPVFHAIEARCRDSSETAETSFRF